MSELSHWWVAQPAVGGAPISPTKSTIAARPAPPASTDRTLRSHTRISQSTFSSGRPGARRLAPHSPDLARRPRCVEQREDDVDDLLGGPEPAEGRARRQAVHPQRGGGGPRVGDDAEGYHVDAHLRGELDGERAQARLQRALRGEVRDVVRVRAG